VSLVLIQGDARTLPLQDASVHCAVTSPPYWGLRSYSIGVDNGEIGLEPLHSCGRGEADMHQLRKDLTPEERAYVIAELRKVGLI
jgi:hypothetical protein